jgi:hypothetical protein
MLNLPSRNLFVSLVLLVLAWLPLASQAADTTGSGKLASETRTLPEFQAIELAARWT